MTIVSFLRNDCGMTGSSDRLFPVSYPSNRLHRVSRAAGSGLTAFARPRAVAFRSRNGAAAQALHAGRHKMPPAGHDSASCQHIAPTDGHGKIRDDAHPAGDGGFRKRKPRAVHRSSKKVGVSNPGLVTLRHTGFVTAGSGRPPGAAMRAAVPRHLILTSPECSHTVLA